MSTMTIVAGDPAKAAPLTPAQADALRSLSLDQWPAAMPIYEATRDAAQREAVAAMSAEARERVGESLLRFAEAQYENCPEARAVMDEQVLIDREVAGADAA